MPVNFIHCTDTLGSAETKYFPRLGATEGVEAEIPFVIADTPTTILNILYMLTVLLYMLIILIKTKEGMCKKSVCTCVVCVMCLCVLCVYVCVCKGDIHLFQQVFF